MKKIFAVGMAALLLAGACAFAACDLDGNGDGERSSANQSQNTESGNNQGGGSNQGSGNNQGSGSNQGGGTTVTAEEWATAMNLKSVDNFTWRLLDIDESGTAIMDEWYMLYKYDGLKWYQRHSGFTGPNDYGQYCVITGESDNEVFPHFPCIQYRSDDGVHWKGEKTSAIWECGGILELLISAQMEEFTYDEEKGCYTVDHAITLSLGGEAFLYDPCVHMEIYFENGKLVRIKETEIDTEADERVEHRFQIDVYDYGTTVVTIPTND